MTTQDQIKKKLEARFQPTTLILENHSDEHEGHPGNSGGGHYYLTISAKELDGLNRVKAHQLIYETLGDLMKQAIHALAIQVIPTDQD